MFKTVANSDCYLRRQPVLRRVNWRANDRRETGIDHSLTAHNYEYPRPARISRRRMPNPIHPRRASRNDLIFEDVFRFSIEFVNDLVGKSDLHAHIRKVS